MAKTKKQEMDKCAKAAKDKQDKEKSVANAKVKVKAVNAKANEACKVTSLSSSSGPFHPVASVAALLSAGAKQNGPDARATSEPLVTQMQPTSPQSSIPPSQPSPPLPPPTPTPEKAEKASVDKNSDKDKDQDNGKTTAKVADVTKVAEILTEVSAKVPAEVTAEARVTAQLTATQVQMLGTATTEVAEVTKITGVGISDAEATCSVDHGHGHRHSQDLGHDAHDGVEQGTVPAQAEGQPAAKRLRSDGQPEATKKDQNEEGNPRTPPRAFASNNLYLDSVKLPRSKATEARSETDMSTDCANGQGLDDVNYIFHCRKKSNPNCPEDATPRRLDADFEVAIPVPAEAPEFDFSCFWLTPPPPPSALSPACSDPVGRVDMTNFLPNLCKYMLHQCGPLDAAKPSHLPDSLQLVSLCSGSGTGELTWKLAVGALAEALVLPLSSTTGYVCEISKWKQGFLINNILEEDDRLGYLETARSIPEKS